MCYVSLPVTLYPLLGVPKVTISGTYPGASPRTIEDSVIRPIEEKLVNLNGIDFVEASANANGGVSVSATFNSGVDSLKALIDIQNAIALSEPQLPDVVKNYGLSITNDTSSLIIAVNLYSAKNEVNQLFVSNYAAKKIVNELSKIKGVYKVVVFGELTYAMRIWLKPEKLKEHGLSIADLRSVLQEQNVVRSIGKIGEPPNSDDQMFEFLIQSPEGLSSAEEFENVIVRADDKGTLLLLKDVATIELGSYSYNETARLDNKPSALIGVFQSQDANGLEIAKQVRKKMSEIETGYPFDLSHVIRFDKSLYIDKAISGIIKTLIEASLIVLLVVALFLKSWRAAIIPSVVIPISLLGTLLVLYLIGSSVNIVSLLGMVLAIGIVVDDAIVVVERVTHLMEHSDLNATEATILAAKELTRPIIATTLVLLAAFIPIAFMPGFTGSLYKEFAITISIAVTISAVAALTLSPSLCALILTPKDKNNLGLGERKQVKSISLISARIQLRIIRHPWSTMSLFGLSIIGIIVLIKIVPLGLVPNEDQGSITIMAQTPDGSSLNRIESVMQEITNIANEDPALDTILVVNGYNYIGGNGSRNGLAFAIMKDWSIRDDSELSVNATISRLKDKFSDITAAQTYVVSPAAVPGLGAIDGYSFQIKDIYGRAPELLGETVNNFIQRIKQEPELASAATSYRTNVPQYKVEIDSKKTKILGVKISDIYDVLGTLLGSSYVNNFTLWGRKYRVIMQAAPEYRQFVENISGFYVKSEKGTMVPISELVKITQFEGPITINHFNFYPSASVNGQINPSYSLGSAIEKINSLKSFLPDGYEIEWTGESRQSIESGRQLYLIIGIAILVSYLVLVSIYESWLIPFSILAVIPGTILGAYFSMYLWNGTNNIYAQMGLVLLIGMATKTAVLIVDAAQQIKVKGVPHIKSAISAVRVRIRAVLMTSTAFTFGVLPLLFSTGPGAGAKISISTPILGGMILLVAYSVFLVAYFYQILLLKR